MYIYVVNARFLLRRVLEVIVGTNIALALIQQWIIPSAVNSLIPFSVSVSYEHYQSQAL